MRPVEGFRAALESAGLTPPAEIIPGKLHRFPSNGKRGDDAGWCKLFEDGRGGVFGDLRSGLKSSWQAEHERPRSQAEREAFMRRCEEAKERAKAEEARERAEARTRAEGIWKSIGPASEHPYLSAKGVKAHGIRQQGDRLVIPARDSAGELHSLQFIDAEGGKRYLKNGRMSGCYHGIGKPETVLCIAEGYATAASIYEATGHAVAVAFDAGNLGPVALALRAKYSKLVLVLCADDDAATAGNPGLTKAKEAARAVGGLLAVPDFGDDRLEGASDFNDLVSVSGPDAVRACIDAAKPVEVTGPANVASEGGDWPELLPLVAETGSKPYPLNALPGVIGEAVREVVGCVQCPDALAACSALGAVSLVVQGLADVRRADRLEGPTSLYLLAIAESGERKTATDRHFLGAIRDWEAAQIENAKPLLARHVADLAAWEAKRDGLLQRIKENSRKDKPSEAEERELQDIEAEKPTPPRVPRLVFGEATAEALAWKLASGWPSAGVVTSEAGIVFGGHSNRQENVVRNLAQLNVLWDGGALPIDRRTSESFTVRGARLTMGLAVQPDTMRAFIEATKGLARGSGFAARFLVARPDSTQGYRPFKDAPSSWPRLSAFHSRVAELLATPLRFTDAGILAPEMLDLSPEAKAAWIAFADEVEVELRPGGDMERVRSEASKAAENCARVAGLFHVFQHGPTGNIGPEDIRAAADVVTWHLYEADRLLGEMALPIATINAERLEAWLLRECKASGSTTVSTRDVLRRGPSPTRKCDAMMAALAELAHAGRARELEDGRRRWIEVRPELLKEEICGAS